MAELKNEEQLKLALKEYTGLLDNVTGRELSWDKCFEVFSKAREDRPINEEDYIDYLCLHLAWFLASWGMLRNSFLMNYNHTVHKNVVELILKEDFDKLVGVSCKGFSECTTKFNELVEGIRDSYPDGCKPSDTLVSKILLGTMGCTPAFDTYFDKALKECEITPKSFNSTTIEQFGQIITALKCDELVELKKHYPEMKIVDMAMWQRGYDIESEEKANIAITK